jgi:hypothetical protein
MLADLIVAMTFRIPGNAVASPDRNSASQDGDLLVPMCPMQGISDAPVAAGKLSE